MPAKRINVWLQETSDYVAGQRLSGGRWVVCRHVGVWRPPTDVYENEDGLVVRVELGGMRSEDFLITLMGRRLVVAGTRVDPSPKRTYHQMEIRFGEFRAEVDLPWQVQPEDVEATYDEGFLEVRLPRPGTQRVCVVDVESEED